VFRRTLLAAGLALCASAQPALSQFVPGGPRSGSADRRGYIAQVQTEVRHALNLLEVTWSQGDPEAITELFARDALVAMEAGSTARGPRQIREWAAGELARGATMVIQVEDFLTSGELAHVVCTILPPGGAPDGPKRAAAILLRRGVSPGEWVIRSMAIAPADSLGR
jgi:hypothetical protein